MFHYAMSLCFCQAFCLLQSFRQSLSLLIHLKPIEQDLLLLLYIYHVSLEVTADLLNLPLETAQHYLRQNKEHLTVFLDSQNPSVPE